MNRVLQQPQPATLQRVADSLQVLVDFVRVERFVQRAGLAPAEHLLLLVDARKVCEKLSEAGDQVGLRHQHEHRESHGERAANVVEEAGEFSAFFRDDLIGVLDQARGRNHQQQAVDRAVLSHAGDELEELAPLGLGVLAAPCEFFDLLIFLDVFAFGGGRGGLRGGGRGVDGEPASRVEDDGLLGEPPVHVRRAAGALLFFGQTGRKLDAATADRFGFARARLADEQIPRAGTHRLFGFLLIDADAFFESLGELIEAGDEFRVAHAARLAAHDVDEAAVGLFEASLAANLHQGDVAGDDLCDDRQADTDVDHQPLLEPERRCQAYGAAANQGAAGRLHAIGNALGRDRIHHAHRPSWLVVEVCGYACGMP